MLGLGVLAGELVVVLIPLAPAGLGAGAGAAEPRPGTLSQSERSRGESSAYCATQVHCTLHTRLQPRQALDIDKVGRVSSALFYIMSRSLGIPKIHRATSIEPRICINGLL